MINIRKILTGRLSLDKGFIIHSCIIEFNGVGILFSAASGTGKSTHARLWQKVFPTTKIINGDNGFCRIIENTPIIFSTPWCGDSNQYTDKSIPIKAIVFLEQAYTNSIEQLNELDSFLYLSARCYLPFWDEELINKSLEVVKTLTTEVDCYLLKCLPDHDAVRIVYDEIFGL